jgi:sulfite exporter TauE/SafE
MTIALIASAALMGLAAAPHCALMCSTPCALAARRRDEQLRLLAGRLVGYGGAGVIAAASARALARMSQGAAVLQPLWALLQAALLVLGLTLLVRGRVPVWLANARWRPAPGRSFATGLHKHAGPRRRAGLDGAAAAPGWRCVAGTAPCRAGAGGGVRLGAGPRGMGAARACLLTGP